MLCIGWVWLQKNPRSHHFSWILWMKSKMSSRSAVPCLVASMAAVNELTSWDDSPNPVVIPDIPDIRDMRSWSKFIRIKLVSSFVSVSYEFYNHLGEIHVRRNPVPNPWRKVPLKILPFNHHKGPIWTHLFAPKRGAHCKKYPTFIPGPARRIGSCRNKELKISFKRWEKFTDVVLTWEFHQQTWGFI